MRSTLLLLPVFALGLSACKTGVAAPAAAAGPAPIHVRVAPVKSEELVYRVQALGSLGLHLLALAALTTAVALAIGVLALPSAASLGRLL